MIAFAGKGLKGEINMEMYEPLKMEVIKFEPEDIITASNDGDTSWAPIGI